MLSREYNTERADCQESVQQTAQLSQAAHAAQPEQYQRPLTRLDEKQRIPSYVAVDIETGIDGENPLGGTLVGVAWTCGKERDATGIPVVHMRRDVESWVDALFSRQYRGCVWVAHNGGEYDYKWLIEYLVNEAKKKYQFTMRFITRNDNRVIGIIITYQKRQIRLIDSFALVPTSLAKLTAAYSPEMKKQERVWTNPDGSINYWRFDNSEDKDYLRHDVLSLLSSIESLSNILYATFGVNTRITAASTALAAWRHTLPEEYKLYRPRPEVEAIAREAYHGGCVFLTSTQEHTNMVHLDVNAMYAWSMRQGVPDGYAFRTDRYEDGLDGIYHCRVTVPSSERYPLCGAMLPHGGIAWATGTFDTTLCSSEIDEARRLGHDVTVYDGIAFSEHNYPFNDFLYQCEMLEKAHKQDAQGTLAKLLRNSLYGKFGSKDTVTRLEYIPDGQTVPEALTPVIDEKTGDIINGFYEAEESLNVAYIQPHWAAWITANARIYLNRLAHTTHAIYGDTDSIVACHTYVESAIQMGTIAVGTAYGELKQEAEYARFISGGPKNYQAVTLDGRTIDKAKGMPRDSIDAEEHYRALHGEVITKDYLSVNATRQTLLKNAGKTTQRQRSYSQLANSKAWRVNGEGVVRPIHIRA